MNDSLKEVFPTEFSGAHLLKPLPKTPPPGVVGVIAQDTARFSMFGASMTSLVVPPGTRCEWQIGQGINDNCNNLTRTLLERPQAEWLWLMGDDHIFAPDTLMRLLAHDVDIVVPLCLMRAAPFQPVIFGEFMEDGVNRRYLDLSEHPEGGLVEVHSAGSAGMLIRKRVFDALPDPWFESRDRVMQAEDLYFCDKAREAGFKIFADLDTPLGHLTSTAVWPVRHPDGWAFGFRFPDGFELAMPAGVWITEEEGDDERAA